FITSPLIVGLQSTVGWSQRGVVTGGAMFSRFLGQSLGAAVFGAITNVVLLHRLSQAPANLRGKVPSRVDGISQALEGGHEDPAAAAFLREALQASAHAVFLGLLIAGIATVVILIVLVPRRFPSGDDLPVDEPAE
ncbi:MAG TPA: hypothetical protein VIJ07_16275, partial [Dermatophilaceae bacterium]